MAHQRSHGRFGRALAGALLVLAWLVALPGASAALPPLDRAAAGPRPVARLAGVSTPVWTWPLSPTPRVVRPFEPPPSTYAAGHRGVDLAAGGGAQVLAVDAGLVTHAAVLAGRGTISIEHANGIKSTYEPVTTTLTRGVRVAGGQLIGTLEPAGSHCAPASCLHLGALRQGSDGEWRYVQPLFLLLGADIVLLPG